ncbi:MAG: DNA repair protein RecN [Acidobacteriota bacterium]
MLKVISITNLALIDRLQIEFSSGLNLLSGETGSGKSIIIDALGLLQGGRASQEMIRSGAERAAVEGLFDLEGNEPLLNLLAAAGIEGLEEGLVIRREITGGGRGRIFVNHQIATTTLLKSIQPHIIDLHGQGDQQSLLSPEAQLNLLDSFCDAHSLRREVAESYERIIAHLEALEEAGQSDAERLQSLDMLSFQIGELESAGIRPLEDEELEMERRLLANAGRLATLGHDSFLALYEDESAVLTRLGQVLKRMADLSTLDPRFAPYLEQLNSARLSIEDTAYFLRDYIEGINLSPERLQEVEDRLAELDRLRRKYGTDLPGLLGRLAELRRQQESLLHHEEHAEAHRQLLRDELTRFRLLESELREARLAGAGRLEEAVARELADVALANARWRVGWRPSSNPPLVERIERALGQSVAPIRRSGGEQVEFQFSANPGEELRPLAAVASGGELSRLMLVLKTVIAPTLFPRTLIFDEIDVGIGGKVADAVGQRLKRLAASNQVLCVTHQPLIARYADAHFQVSKEVVEGRTLTSVAPLTTEGRIEELARMIGGDSVSPSARRHARELLRNQEADRN